MRNIHILNPAAGMAKANYKVPENVEVYETKGPRDMENFIRRTASEDPSVHFTVYGGDGTVNEAVNGIMTAGNEAIEKCVLSVVPKGSGNDYARNFSDTEKFNGKVDVLKINDRYGINSVNIGFDCDVVVETDKLKRHRLTSGSMGYIVGVIKVLFRKLGSKMQIEITEKNGKIHNFDGEFLLTAVGNGKYCGGGFKFAPAAVLDDGSFDALVVKKMGRFTFLKLVGAYRSGTHVDVERCEPREKFKSEISYFKCKKMTVKNIKRYGIDGEIFDGESVEITVIPRALNIEMPPFDLTKTANKKK
ncbi:MAG: hypothetical protein IJN17_06420 [Clostridia bacterium]|nr:hypothetical protein [Clostridia bacterium]